MFVAICYISSRELKQAHIISLGYTQTWKMTQIKTIYHYSKSDYSTDTLTSAFGLFLKYFQETKKILK
jgi:hypothetical protein